MVASAQRCLIKKIIKEQASSEWLIEPEVPKVGEHSRRPMKGLESSSYEGRSCTDVLSECSWWRRAVKKIWCFAFGDEFQNMAIRSFPNQSYAIWFY
jgi:hypothetical protein